MKKIFLALSLIFVLLTFIGAGYVLYTKGEANAGYAIIPMVISLACISLYRSKFKNEKGK